MFHLLRFPVHCKQIQNADPQSCCYPVCLSCIYSCYDYAGAISTRVSMRQNCTQSQSIFGKVNMSEGASIMAGFKESTWKLTGVIWEVTATPRGQVLGLYNPRARPWYRPVLCGKMCYVQDVQLVLLSVTTHGSVALNKNNTRHLCSFQSVTESVGATWCYCPKGNRNWVYAHSIVTPTLKPQTWIKSVVKHRRV